jgi:solute:Na+ symporter, SSS family
MQNPISLIDSLIIVIYLLVVLAIGLSVKYSDKTLLDYFLSGRKLGWFAIGISLFATNISSEHIIGLAGGGATRGLAIAQFELIAIFFLILLGWFVGPIYRRSNVLTTPEFIERRFDARSRKLYSGLSIFTYILTKVLVTLFAGGILLNKVFGLSTFTSSIIIIIFTGVYTLVGGFSAVVRTQVFQGILLIVGASLVTFFGLQQVGGLQALRDKLPMEHFQMFKPMSDPDFPWTGILFGAPIIAFWYWCADHYMVQRILAAKSSEQARTGTIVTSFLKILPLFILVIPGLIAIVLYPDIRGDEAYPALLSGDLLPIGIRGIVICGFIAAMMSSLSAAFNSIAALYTIDFFKANHPEASERTLVLVGRMATIVIIFIVLLIVPFIKLVNSNIYIFLQSTQAFISAPISAVFLFGFILKKIDTRSVLISCIVGETFGISRFVIQFLTNAGWITNPVLLAYTKINYLHFTIFLFMGTSALMMILRYIFLYHQKYSLEQNYSFSNFSKQFGDKNVWSLSANKLQMFLSFAILLITLSLWMILI